MTIALVGWPPNADCLTAAQVDALLSADVLVADGGWSPPSRERFMRAGAEWVTVTSAEEAGRVVSEESARVGQVVRVVPLSRLAATWDEERRRLPEGLSYRAVPGMRATDVQLGRWGIPAGALREDAWAANDVATQVAWVKPGGPPVLDAKWASGWVEMVRPDGQALFAGWAHAAPWPQVSEPVLVRWSSEAEPPARRVLILRADGQAGPLAEAARQAGYTPVLAPILEIASPDWDPADVRLRALSRYGWVVFTSANGVMAALDRLRFLGIDIRTLKGQIAAVGDETRRRLLDVCLSVDLVASGDGGQEGLVAAFSRVDHLSGQSVLLVVGSRRGPRLVEGLRALGAIVDEAVVYRTVPRPLDHEVVASLTGGQLQAVFFTSGSTAQFLWAALPEAGRAKLREMVRVSIGQSTARVLQQLGIPATVVAQRPDAASMVAALVDWQRRADVLS